MIYAMHPKDQHKSIGAKAGSKMLVKLTKGERVNVVTVLDRKSTISAETDFFSEMP